MKASEYYIDVVFNYKNKTLETSVPLSYRRTGTFIGDSEVDTYLEKVYTDINPKKWRNWKKTQDLFWASKKSKVTKPFFDKLSKNFTWCCVSCELPQNPNYARRIQNIKEFGYTLSTKPNKECSKCGQSTTHLVLLPLKRGGITGYENLSHTLKTRIINLLKSYDVFEAKLGKKEGLLPDHKFPEIRWDKNTKRKTLKHLNDKDILNDFQLLSNQRNQQKREVCRKCYQTNERGILYGIPFFYKGNKNWDLSIPRLGKGAEKGCVGCGWYDLEKWRKELTKKLPK